MAGSLALPVLPVPVPLGQALWTERGHRAGSCWVFLDHHDIQQLFPSVIFLMQSGNADPT